MRLQGEEGMGAVQHNTSPARGQTIREIVWFSQSFPFKNGDREAVERCYPAVCSSNRYDAISQQIAPLSQPSAASSPHRGARAFAPLKVTKKEATRLGDLFFVT